MTVTSPMLQGRHVLIVEDDYWIAKKMVEAFEATGAVIVGPVPDVKSALDLIQDDGTIEVAVLDVNLGGELVYPVADALRERGVPFVFATGYDRSHIADRFRDVRTCEKPIDASAICAALPIR